MQVLDENGKFLRKFSGSGKLALRTPTGVAIDSIGNLVVCEMNNNRVQVLRPGLDGDFGLVTTFGTRYDDTISTPWSVAVDSHDRVYVAGQMPSVYVFAFESGS